MQLFHSTRNDKVYVTSKQAIRQGIADDGGLFVADWLGKEKIDISSIGEKSYQTIAQEVLSLLLPDFSEEELYSCVHNAYQNNFSDGSITPLKSLGTNYVLELFHGPTSAFKDIALQILPHLMTRAISSDTRTSMNEKILILTATSGDTGKAALDGFAGVDSTGILVFYPAGQVSDIQKLQMVTQHGDNVSVVAVHGNFDDAQSAVKSIFADSILSLDIDARAHTQLSSANSINIGRLAPQVAYYFSAYSQLVASREIENGDSVDFIVPTGNFGNVLAGYYALRLGLPIRKLVVASDKNKVLYDFLTTGVYDKNRPFYTTISPSMDILLSSNLERMLYYFSDGDTELIARLMNDLSTTGRYTVPEAIMTKIRTIFDCSWADEKDIRTAIADCWEENNYVIDPHTACAYHALSTTISTDDTARIIVSTASPYKFPHAVLESLDQPTQTALHREMTDFECMDALHSFSSMPIPDNLRTLEGKEIRFTDEIEVADMPQYVINVAMKFAR